MPVGGHVAALVGVRPKIAREGIIRPEYAEKLERDPVGDLPAVLCPLRTDIEVFGVVPLILNASLAFRAYSLAA